MKFFLIITLLYATATTGQSSRKVIKGKYSGWWADTYWTYTFDKKNIFHFLTRGHYGNSSTVGKYLISGDSIFIKAFPTAKTFLIDTLLIDGDSCIIELSTRYDYCKKKRSQKIPHESRKRPMTKIEAIKIRTK